MAARRMMLPDYGTVSMKGTQYYRTRVTDQQGRRVSLYARTREELYQKEQEAIQQIENKTYRRSTPTVEEYCEKWLLMQSAQIRMTTLIDYTSKVKNYIIKPLGDMHMGDVTADDIRLALLAASKKSASVYKSVNVIYKCIFTAAMESKIIDENPTIYLKKNVGGIPQRDRLPLTDEQVDTLLDAIYGLPPYVFVMLGLYAGLRREEILGLQWDSVYLDCEAPYLTVRRAWHTEHNPSGDSDRDENKGSASECPSAGQSSGMSERGEEGIDIGLCGCKPGWRPFVLYAVQEIMAVYRNPYHQGTLLLSL